jgi:type III restriction enzyme
MAGRRKSPGPFYVCARHGPLRCDWRCPKGCGGPLGDLGVELAFAGFLETCDDLVSWTKNYLAIRFKLDYVNAAGEISNYYPDFIAKKTEAEIFIVETKGLEDMDVPLKMARLRQWCDDLNRVQGTVRYGFVYVDEEGFKKYKPADFTGLVAGFTEYQGGLSC